MNGFLKCFYFPEFIFARNDCWIATQALRSPAPGKSLSSRLDDASAIEVRLGSTMKGLVKRIYTLR